MVARQIHLFRIRPKSHDPLCRDDDARPAPNQPRASATVTTFQPSRTGNVVDPFRKAALFMQGDDDRVPS